MCVDGRVPQRDEGRAAARAREPDELRKESGLWQEPLETPPRLGALVLAYCQGRGTSPGHSSGRGPLPRLSLLTCPLEISSISVLSDDESFREQWQKDDSKLAIPETFPFFDSD